MHILDILFPKRCVSCGRIGTYFCSTCRRRIRPITVREMTCPVCGRSALNGFTHPRCKTRYSLDGLTSYFHYDNAVRKGIKAIKYRYVSDIAQEFISLASVSGFKTYMLIPVPLHPKRLRARGFNQAEVLGSLIASRLHIPVRTAILRRVRETPPQAEAKSREVRLKNMEHVFVSAPASGNILLFDDVYTTGATMRSAAGALKRAGARRVWAVTMAR